MLLLLSSILVFVVLVVVILVVVVVVLDNDWSMRIRGGRYDRHWPVTGHRRYL